MSTAHRRGADDAHASACRGARTVAFVRARERSIAASVRPTLAAVCVAAAAGAFAQEGPRESVQAQSNPIAAWSRTQAAPETAASPAERGAAVFNNWCSACHGRGPMNAPGTASLENKYQGSLPALLEDREDLTPELVEFYVRNGVATMPFFRPTELSDEDVAALAAYLTER